MSKTKQTNVRQMTDRLSHQSACQSLYFSFHVQKHWINVDVLHVQSAPKTSKKMASLFFFCWHCQPELGSHPKNWSPDSWHPQLGSMAAPWPFLPGNQGWPPQEGGPLRNSTSGCRDRGNHYAKKHLNRISVSTWPMFYIFAFTYLYLYIKGQNPKKTACE